MVKNKVVLKERDAWSDLANFIGEMVAKYAEVMDLDSLPDPDHYLLMKRILEKPEESLEITIGERDLSKLYAGKKKYFREVQEKKKVKVTIVPDKVEDIIEIRPLGKGCSTCI